MKFDLSKANEKLKARGARSHQNVKPVPKELHELKRATHKLEAETRKLQRAVEETKRKKKILRG
jgi:predicted RNase H-like nuclease (RuvC/YqgF family)